ncbi:MAG: BrnT family toxin [Sphingomonadales bacterium]
MAKAVKSTLNAYIFLDESPHFAYIHLVDIEFDSAKNKINITKHGVSLELAVILFGGPHILIEDNRRDYGEARFWAFGKIQGREYVCVYAERTDRVRVISLRKANRREVNAYYKS